MICQDRREEPGSHKGVGGGPPDARGGALSMAGRKSKQRAKGRGGSPREQAFLMPERRALPRRGEV